MRLDYITKVKSTTWNADVIIEHNTYKVAFNVYKCLHNVEATYKAMRKERVYRCWLLLPAVNSSYQEQKDHEIGSPDKPGGLSIQLCKSEKKEFYIRYSS